LGTISYGPKDFGLAKIDQPMRTGAGLDDISRHPQIDCPEYRNLLTVISLAFALMTGKCPWKDRYSGDKVYLMAIVTASEIG
jgi:hypothetical protein